MTRIFTLVFELAQILASIGMLVTRETVKLSDLLMMIKMSRIKRMRLMYMKVEVPLQKNQQEKQPQSEALEAETGAERRATATAEPLDAAATRSADGSSTATEAEARDARDTAPLPPLLHRAAALDRSAVWSPFSFPFCFCFCFFVVSLLYSFILTLHIA